MRSPAVSATRYFLYQERSGPVIYERTGEVNEGSSAPSSIWPSTLTASSFLLLRIPIEKDRDGHRRGFFRELIDQEPSIARDGVLGSEQICHAAGGPRGKQRHG